MRALVLVAAASVVLTGCSGGSDEPDGQKPAQAEATATSEAATQADLTDPTPAQRTALVKALKRIDRTLVADEARAVEDALETCRELLDTEGRRTGRGIVTAAQLRFSGRVELTEAETRKVITASRDTVCPDAAWP